MVKQRRSRPFRQLAGYEQLVKSPPDKGKTKAAPRLGRGGAFVTIRRVISRWGVATRKEGESLESCARLSLPVWLQRQNQATPTDKRKVKGEGFAMTRVAETCLSRSLNLNKHVTGELTQPGIVVTKVCSYFNCRFQYRKETTQNVLSPVFSLLYISRVMKGSEPFLSAPDITCANSKEDQGTRAGLRLRPIMELVLHLLACSPRWRRLEPQVPKTLGSRGSPGGRAEASLQSPTDQPEGANQCQE
jgi:hypothetical protein